jgi:hypothetical protein
MAVIDQMNKVPKLSLGPIPYFWPRETVFRFYEAMAETHIDIVYLGETVCAKRRLMKMNDWYELAAMLTSAGKEVVISTMTLIEAHSELSTLRTIRSKPTIWPRFNYSPVTGTSLPDLLSISTTTEPCRYWPGPV